MFIQKIFSISLVICGLQAVAQQPNKNTATEAEAIKKSMEHSDRTPSGTIQNENTPKSVHRPGSGAASSSGSRYADVETLLDQRDQLDGKTVAVTGQLDKRLNNRAMILKSGGVVNNRILVLSKADLTFDKLEKKPLTVTGALRNITPEEAQKEFGWAKDSEIEKEVRKIKTVLIADDIVVPK